MASFFKLRVRPLWLAVASFTALLFIVDYCLSPHLLKKIPLNQLVSNKKDDMAVISNQLLNHVASNKQSIVLLGGSVTREAIAETKQFENYLNKQLDNDIRLLHLGQSSQSLSESLGIIQALNLSKGSHILLQISFRRLVQSFDDMFHEFNAPRLLGTNDRSLQNLLHSAGYQAITWPNIVRLRSIASHYFHERWQSASFHDTCTSPNKWLLGENNQCINAFFKPITVPKNKYWVRSEKKTHAVKKLKTHLIAIDTLPRFVANHAASLEVLQEIQKICISKGYRLTLIEYPHDPVLNFLENQASALYMPLIKTIQQQGTSYVDLRDYNDHFTAADFADPIHFLASGREKFAPLLASSIKNIVEVTND